MVTVLIAVGTGIACGIVGYVFGGHFEVKLHKRNGEEINLRRDK